MSAQSVPQTGARLYSLTQRLNRPVVAFETCVLCGGTTDIPVQLPVQERTGYVPGAGQLCRACDRSVYTLT